MVESILMRNESCKDSVDEDGYTSLHRACYNNHVEIARILLQYGANVNTKTEDEWTPLHSGNFSIKTNPLVYLARIKWNIHFLILAVKWSNLDCTALMIQHGADVNAKVGYRITRVYLMNDKKCVEFFSQKDYKHHCTLLLAFQIVETQHLH